MDALVQPEWMVISCAPWMARTRGKREGPRDPTRQARIDAAVRDTLAGVFNIFQSAAIAYKLQGK